MLLYSLVPSKAACLLISLKPSQRQQGDVCSNGAVYCIGFPLPIAFLTLREMSHRAEAEAGGAEGDFATLLADLDMSDSEWDEWQNEMRLDGYGQEKIDSIQAGNIEV